MKTQDVELLFQLNEDVVSWYEILLVVAHVCFSDDVRLDCNAGGSQLDFLVEEINLEEIEQVWKVAGLHMSAGVKETFGNERKLRDQEDVVLLHLDLSISEIGAGVDLEGLSLVNHFFLEVDLVKFGETHLGRDDVGREVLPQIPEFWPLLETVQFQRKFVVRPNVIEEVFPFDFPLGIGQEFQNFSLAIQALLLEELNFEYPVLILQNQHSCSQDEFDFELLREQHMETFVLDGPNGALINADDTSFGDYFEEQLFARRRLAIDLGREIDGMIPVQGSIAVHDYSKINRYIYSPRLSIN